MSVQVKQLQQSSNSAAVSLNVYNNELVECLRDLREKREQINRAITSEDKRKAEIEDKLHKLAEQLKRVNESLATKNNARNEYDATIAETEAAYSKILESSQTLLTVLKREQSQLVGKTPAIKQLADVNDIDIGEMHNNHSMESAQPLVSNKNRAEHSTNKISSKSFFNFGRTNSSDVVPTPANNQTQRKYN